MQNNNRNANASRKIQIAKITILNIFNKNDDPFANNCRLSLGLCFLIKKALWILVSKLELHFFLIMYFLRIPFMKTLCDKFGKQLLRNQVIDLSL